MNTNINNLHSHQYITDFDIEEYLDNYIDISPFIETAKATARLSHKYIYLVDLYKMEIIDIAGHTKWFCSIKSVNIDADGIVNYSNCIDSSQSLNKSIFENSTSLFPLISDVMTKFADTIPIEERKEYITSFDVRITAHNKNCLFNLQFSPLKLTPNGKVWIALCSLSSSTKSSLGRLNVKRCGDSKYFEYDFRQKRWFTEIEPELSVSEREVLYLSAQGHTMLEISNFLCMSFDTIKTRKRKLFQKLGVQNISEAITYAKNHGLI